MKSSITLGIVFLRFMRQAFRAYPVCLELQGRRSSLHSRDTLDRKLVFQSCVGPENVSAKHSSPNEALRPICRHQAPFQSCIGPHSSRIMTERDATTASLSRSGSFLFSTGHAVSNLTVSGMHDMLAVEGFDLAPCTAECSGLTSRRSREMVALGAFLFCDINACAVHLPLDVLPRRAQVDSVCRLGHLSWPKTLVGSAASAQVSEVSEESKEARVPRGGWHKPAKASWIASRFSATQVLPNRARIPYNMIGYYCTLRRSR